MAELVTVDLESPIARGETIIEALQLRKPKAGELRGLVLSELTRGAVDQILELLPRITMPPLTSAEVEEMDPVNFAACASEVIIFFMSKTQRAQVEKLIATT
ncbi:MAG: phage tail protein [Proteobacteria bacterium SG_bin5]|nr:phage tail assembly protein [Sphingomonas sp.]OQW42078.1 MAG: phage tail protein [Proteobacteria bacterium SG_bin5]